MKGDKNKMKIKKKLLIILILLFTMFFVIKPAKVNAALQANGSSLKTDTIANWLVNIRKMEAAGGTLGLTDTINTTDLTSSASSSNNLDIHMEKNTEYGAMAILSASAYGNQNKINDGETTTGNKSGVYMRISNEWVAAGSLTSLAAFTNANSKYKNEYTTTYVAKAGDAITETSGWHSSGKCYWINYNTVNGLLRGYSGSIFSYSGLGDSPSYSSYYTKSNYTRAVIVVGNGF